ncbi:hypothetical protein C8R48DRAFT_723665 [Suillus tomentosus]|nr:hypothetical protein C8R48DRAFT_723665 [Suillus tomentosus]
MSLAVFDISKVVEHGVEVTPEIDHLPGSAWYVASLMTSGAGLNKYAPSHLKPFKCSIKPRSTTALGLIEQ